MKLDSHYRPRGVVCGPPFVWAMPPDPPPGWVQYFCLRAVDTSDNLSACAEITFLK